MVGEGQGVFVRSWKLSFGLELGGITWFSAGVAPVVRPGASLVVSPGGFVEDRQALE